MCYSVNSLMSQLPKIQISLRPKCRLALVITIPTQYCRINYNQTLMCFKENINIPGFRKGKIPDNILFQHVGRTNVNSIALQLLIESAYLYALKQESINTIGQPELSEGFNSLLERFDPNASLSLVIETDIEPNPIMNRTRGLEIITQYMKYDPSRVDILIEEARERLSTFKLVKDRPARLNDMAIITLVEKSRGIEDADTDYQLQDIEITLNAQCPITDLVEHVIGLTIGEKKFVTCQVPQDHSQIEGEVYEVDFDIVLRELKVRELPNLDDNFAKQISEKNTLDELHLELEYYLQEEAKLSTIRNLQDALLDALIQEFEVEVPETLIQEEMHILIKKTVSQIARKGTDVKQFFTHEVVSNLMETSRPEAEQRLIKSLALKTLAKIEQINITEEEIVERIQEINPEIINCKEIDQTLLVDAVRSDLLRKKLLEWLYVNNSIEIQGVEEEEEQP
uniref:peptidylprolyl isomerase n=1 Tax=Paulinella micropora TaxID=1928728 RepID=A0A385I0E0_9EUKA|nr:trigger factor [Paulinella micropora]AXY63379.1 trigger factor [Paulinella micropora]